MHIYRYVLVSFKPKSNKYNRIYKMKKKIRNKHDKKNKENVKIIK